MTFGCMILNGALLLLLRSFGAAMLIIANKNYFIAYLAGDVALYLLQKALRSDLCLTCDLPRPHEEKVQLYRKTFFSLQTGNEWAQSRFLNEENSDETRAAIIGNNRHLWQSICPQVRE